MEREGFDPYIATERQRHNQALAAAAGEPAVSPATPKEKMRAKLGTESGRELYARRKTIVEPVFGQIKEARGFRRFLLRGPPFGKGLELPEWGGLPAVDRPLGAGFDAAVVPAADDSLGL